MNCIASPPPSLLEPLMVQDAVEFLRRSHLPIPPRLRWPRGAVEELTGAIHLRNEPGWALSIYGDAGWGRAVAVAKYETSTISDDLIAAAVECIRDKWQPSAHDGWWVTSIPSGRRTRLVADAANAIAKELGLPYRDDVISKVIDAPVQKEMQNSAMQLRNAYRSLGIAESPLTGPVILIDDVVDSRWTFTVAGHLLRSHGSGPVYPFAFASAAGRDQ